MVTRTPTRMELSSPAACLDPGSRKPPFNCCLFLAGGGDVVFRQYGRCALRVSESVRNGCVANHFVEWIRSHDRRRDIRVRALGECFAEASFLCTVFFVLSGRVFGLGSGTALHASVGYCFVSRDGFFRRAFSFPVPVVFFRCAGVSASFALQNGVEFFSQVTELFGSRCLTRSIRSVEFNDRPALSITPH